VSVPMHKRPDEGAGNGMRPQLRDVLERVETVPTLPDVITRILSVIDDPDASAFKVAAVMGKDQSMVSSILKLVNSPFYGLSGRVTSIQHAVVLVGFRTIRNVALSSVLIKVFGDGEPRGGFDRKGLWRHTVACATGARMLASRVKCADPEEAFLAGLLHDMGIVILDQYFHQDFRRVLSLVADGSRTLRQAEREVFGHDHAAVGGLLARKWNFPPAVVEAIAWHHAPERSRRAPELAALVHLSNYLVPPGPVGGAPNIWETDPCDPAAFALARMEPDDLPELQAAFDKEWAKAQAFLDLLA
jgi:putative nucleotidyltransferase with HDIG domain